MIKSIDIHNYGPHKDTHIDWNDGFCVLSGTSGAGKSSIRRAILWPITNRPSGTSFINWDCFDAKGVLIDKCSVTLTMDNGNTVTRERSPIFNGYFVQTPDMAEPKRLEAVGTDVPEEVTRILGFTDVNYQKQFDHPFLIDTSSGEVAKYINKLVNLEDADIYQASVESKRKENDKALKDTEEAIAVAQQAVSALSWCNSAKQLIKQYDECQQKASETAAKIQRAKGLMEDMHRLEVRTKATARYKEALELVSQITPECPDKARLERARGLLQQFTQLKEEYKATKAGEKALELIQQITTIQNTVDSDKKKIEKAKNLMQTAVQNHKNMIQYTKEIEEVDSELASVDVCPLCGSKLGG